jgi:hypothetical protein
MQFSSGAAEQTSITAHKWTDGNHSFGESCRARNLIPFWNKQSEIALANSQIYRL